MTSAAPALEAIGRATASVFVAMACALLPLALTHAQPAADPPSTYEQAVSLAFHEFELGNYPEARARFLEAHKLYPNARTLRALGMVDYELRNYGDAIEQLEGALASRVKPLESQARLQTESLLAQARGYVARVELDLSPSTATIVLDGAPLELPPGRTLLLQIGDHDLEFRAPGRLVERRQLKIKGGEVQSMKIALAPEGAAAADGSSERPALKRNPWLWGALAVVVAGAAVGVAVGLTRDREREKTDPPYGGSSSTVFTVP